MDTRRGTHKVARTTSQARNGSHETRNALGLTFTEDETDASRVDRSLDSLAGRTERWLLVYDNVDDPAAMARWQPAVGNGQIIITTRAQTTGPRSERFNIGCFDPDSGARFLVDRVSNDNPAAAQDRDGARAVSVFLGGLPLALEQAGAMVCLDPDYRFASYLDRLRADLASELDRAQRLGDYPVNSYRTFVDSITDAVARAPAADLVLLTLSWFDPDTAVPVDLLRRTVPEPLTADDVDAALMVLAKRSLIRRDNDGVYTHRLVQQASGLRNSELGRNADAAHEWALQSLLVIYNTTQFHTVAKACRALEVHADIVLDNQQWSSTKSLLADRVAAWYQNIGDLGRALPLNESARADRTRVLGPDHPDTLISCDNLAGAYRRAGDLNRSIPLYEQNLADRMRVLGPDDPSTLMSRNNLAVAYAAAGSPGEVIVLHEQNLADRMRVLGPDHPSTLISRNNLAEAHALAGSPGEAIVLYEQNLADRMRVLGPDHPSTLITRNNLAFAYGKAGDVASAIPLYERTLDDRIRVLGPDHPSTLITRNNLAYAYAAAGNARQAISLHHETLIDRTRVLGPDHPSTLISRNNLAEAYAAAGSPGEAIVLHEQNLNDRTRVLGPDHPSTLTSRNNLADAYQAAGDLARATPLYEQPVNDRTRVLGPDHPDTLTSRKNKALAMWAAGDRASALAITAATLATAERSLSQGHPLATHLRQQVVSMTAAIDDP